MTESPDVVAALLYVVDNSSPFNLDGSNPLYESVKLKRGFQRGEMETPTVALYPFGGGGQRKGQGTVDQWRTSTIRCDVLTETYMDGMRIVEKVRAAWQSDFNCEANDIVGEVGTGYVRETGGVKDIQFAEPRELPWDEKKSVVRLSFDITVKFGD